MLCHSEGDHYYSISNLISNTFTFLFLSVGLYLPRFVCGSHRTACTSQFSPSSCGSWGSNPDGQQLYRLNHLTSPIFNVFETEAENLHTALVGV